MRKRPFGSWWPSERHSRAVSTSSSSPTSRSNSSSPVAGLVAGDGVGDVGVDVERGRAGRPVAGALLAADRPPRERGACEPELVRPLAREVERRVPPAERVGGRVRSGVGEHRQDEALGVPERVAVVAGAGQALRRDRALLGARAGLQRVEEREAHGLLQLRVALELDVGAVPELVEVRPLVVDAGRPSRCGAPRRARPRPGRGPPGASAGSTSRRRGT